MTAVLLAGCGGSRLSPGLIPSAATPAPSPTASDLAIDLALADRLYADGEPDEALIIYSAAALRGTIQEKRRATWALARIQYASGDPGGAVANLHTFIAMQPSPEEERRAHLLLGFARLARGDRGGAKAAFQRYIALHGPAVPYARLELAGIASGEDDNRQAIEQVNLALAAGLPASTTTEALFALARHQEKDSDAASAAATLGKLAAEAATRSDRAEALWQLAQLSRRMGDARSYQESLYSLVVRYPWHRRALQALDEPQLAPSPLPTGREAALTFFENRSNGRAQQAFGALLAEPERRMQGEAHYYLAILAERAGDPEEALNQYRAAIEALAGSASPLLGSALWDRGLLLESVGRLEEAAQDYVAPADAAPASEQAASGLFRAGLIRLRQGRPADAAALWRRYLAMAPAGDSQARAYFWLAKADQALGDSASAAQSLEMAASAAPLSYYGLRAQALLNGETVGADRSEIEPGSPWQGIERWLAAEAGPEPADAPGSATFFADEGWQRALELLRAGLDKQAAEFDALVDQVQGQPWLQYRLARALSEEGQARQAARLAQALEGGYSNAPPELLTLAYPTRFLGPANEAAKANGLSPLLLLALVRQESFFDPAAVSPAGALGLTQVIPSTGREIASQLNEAEFRERDLLKPKVSLRFGAHYLGEQLERFGGRVWVALAAYNGGPANASRWQTAALADPDLFLEVIDFAETHAYVKRVLENYALYRYAYGLSDRPSLPLP